MAALSAYVGRRNAQRRSQLLLESEAVMHRLRRFQSARRECEAERRREALIERINQSLIERQVELIDSANQRSGSNYRGGRIGIAQEDFVPVGGEASEVERQESRIDVARLADDCAENLVVEDAEAGAKDRHPIAPEPSRRIRQTDTGSEVVVIRIENIRAPAGELAETRRETQGRIVEGPFYPVVDFARRRVVLVAQ